MGSNHMSIDGFELHNHGQCSTARTSMVDESDMASPFGLGSVDISAHDFDFPMVSVEDPTMRNSVSTP